MTSPHFSAQPRELDLFVWKGPVDTYASMKENKLAVLKRWKRWRRRKYLVRSIIWIGLGISLLYLIYLASHIRSDGDVVVEGIDIRCCLLYALDIRRSSENTLRIASYNIWNLMFHWNVRKQYMAKLVINNVLRYFPHIMPHLRSRMLRHK